MSFSSILSIKEGGRFKRDLVHCVPGINAGRVTLFTYITKLLRMAMIILRVLLAPWMVKPWLYAPSSYLNSRREQFTVPPKNDHPLIYWQKTIKEGVGVSRGGRFPFPWRILLIESNTHTPTFFWKFVGFSKMKWSKKKGYGWVLDFNVKFVYFFYFFLRYVISLKIN